MSEKPKNNEFLHFGTKGKFFSKTLSIAIKRSNLASLDMRQLEIIPSLVKNLQKRISSFFLAFSYVQFYYPAGCCFSALLRVHIFKCFVSEGFGSTQWFPGQKRDVLINFIHSTKFGYFTLNYRCVSALLRVYVFKCFISEGFGPTQWFPGVLKKL